MNTDMHTTEDTEKKELNHERRRKAQRHTGTKWRKKEDFTTKDTKDTNYEDIITTKDTKSTKRDAQHPVTQV